MPASPSEYLETRALLAKAWEADQAPMALVDAQSQWQIHDYFHFDRPGSEEEALSWLLTVQACEPELEDNGWRALARLHRHLDKQQQATAAPRLVAGGKHQRLGVVVRGVVRPEADVHLYAQALIELARPLQQEDEERAKTPSNHKN